MNNKEFIAWLKDYLNDKHELYNYEIATIKEKLESIKEIRGLRQNSFIIDEYIG